MNVIEWELRFRLWSSGPSASESAKCLNAERVIGDCLRVAGTLDKYQLEIFAQGSYKNATNIPQESDVDICVATTNGSLFFDEYPPGITREHYGSYRVSATFEQLKNDVATALYERFGDQGFKWGSKCLEVHSNTFRVDADVVPAFEKRRYYGAGVNDFTRGIEFISDDGKRITNYPRQHFEQGSARNATTSGRFRSIVRVMKRLQFALVDVGVVADKYVPSYALECAVFNVTDGALKLPSFCAAVRQTLFEIYGAIEREEQWVEVNRLKYLFHDSQPWRASALRQFTIDAWRHVGYE